MDDQTGKDLPENDVKLSPDSELRFEVESKNETVYLEVGSCFLIFRYSLIRLRCRRIESFYYPIQLKSGIAEIFGTELVKGKTYVFATGAKIAVFTWQGCELSIRTRKDSSYIARETPMV